VHARCGELGHGCPLGLHWLHRLSGRLHALRKVREGLIEMSILKSSCLVAMVLLAGQVEAKVTHYDTIHVRANSAASMLKVPGIHVPKIFVLSHTGALQFETPNDPDPEDKALISALSGQKEKAGSPHAVMSILKQAKVDISSETGPVVVSLQGGSTMGRCYPCTVYYPAVEETVGKLAKPVRWVRIEIEANTYGAAKPAPAPKPAH
jgi:hypothetical protein